MTTTFESASEQTEQSTQELPTIPTVKVMESWGKEKVFRWIQQRKPNLLEGDDVNKFKNARITGSSFLLSGFNFFHKICGITPGPSLDLNGLVDEVKKGKSILEMHLRDQLTMS